MAKFLVSDGCFVGVLLIIFIILKLCNVIDCSWIWVILTPIGIYIGLIGLLVVLIVITRQVKYILKKLR